MAISSIILAPSARERCYEGWKGFCLSRSSAERNGLYTIYIDFYKATSLNKFLELYSREVALAVENKSEKAVRFIKEFLPALRPKITVNAEGNAVKRNSRPRAIRLKQEL
ncbi:MAG: hypothetical protein COT43_05150 [Candidatus Marinimicrobia bacterium CG08_land_8_20_14_0_20_45_22]|nr:MAG: hypothetical protein COT43_05150 [Candidatus Marinimicrobia bacterium CG08_land_8_20_14_0_20_45_22]